MEQGRFTAESALRSTGLPGHPADIKSIWLLFNRSISGGAGYALPILNHFKIASLGFHPSRAWLHLKEYGFLGPDLRALSCLELFEGRLDLFGADSAAVPTAFFARSYGYWCFTPSIFLLASLSAPRRRRLCSSAA